MNKILVFLEESLRWRIKYKFWVIAVLIIAPLTDSIYHALSGYYVKTVPYLFTFINYALIFATAYFIERIYSRLVYGISTHFSYKISPIFLYCNIFEFILGLSLFHIIDASLEFLSYAIFISFFVGSIVFRVLFFSIFFSFILLPFTFALTLIFCGLALKFRGRDFSGLRELIGFLLYVAIPYSYSIFILPEPFRTILYYYPSAGLLEELRKYLFLNQINFNHILFLFFESFLFLILGYLFFNKVFKIARQKGWVKLV